MKKQKQTALTTLTRDDIARVAGAGIGPIVTKVPQAQDMYGNTMSHEDWMDYMVGHIHSHGDSTSTTPDKWVHDFGN